MKKVKIEDLNLEEEYSIVKASHIQWPKRADKSDEEGDAKD